MTASLAERVRMALAEAGRPDVDVVETDDAEWPVVVGTWGEHELVPLVQRAYQLAGYPGLACDACMLASYGSGPSWREVRAACEARGLSVADCGVSRLVKDDDTKERTG